MSRGIRGVTAEKSQAAQRSRLSRADSSRVAAPEGPAPRAWFGGFGQSLESSSGSHSSSRFQDFSPPSQPLRQPRTVRSHPGPGRPAPPAMVTGSAHTQRPGPAFYARPTQSPAEAPCAGGTAPSGEGTSPEMGSSGRLTRTCSAAEASSLLGGLGGHHSHRHCSHWPCT